MLDRVIFGDNQFFGINHMSEEKAAEQSEKFRDLDAIISVIDDAYDSGVRAFMLNTHSRVKKICDHFRANPEKYKDIVLYPSMPYAHKYANSVADKGIFGAIRETVLAENSTSEIMSMFAKGGASIFERDLTRLMQILVDMEMKMFAGLQVNTIFLQNIVTDLLVGFGVQDPFIAYAEYIREKYNSEPGFVTLNLPKTVVFLKECGIDNPVVCSTINKIGFNMNPDIDSYESTLKEGGFQAMAMSILASGAIKPSEAIEYVCGIPEIQSVVFGASSKKNIQQTKALLDQYAN